MKDQDRISELGFQLAEAKRGIERLKADNARLAAALVHVAEYWNGSHSDEAMRDACEHIPMAANEALLGRSTALRDLLGPVVGLLAMLEQREHSRDGASHMWKLIDIQLTRLAPYTERKI